MDAKKKAERAVLLSILSVPKGSVDPVEFDRRIREVFDEAARVDELREGITYFRRELNRLQAENGELYEKLDKARPKSWIERLIG